MACQKRGYAGRWDAWKSGVSSQRLGGTWGEWRLFRRIGGWKAQVYSAGLQLPAPRMKFRVVCSCFSCLKFISLGMALEVCGCCQLGSTWLAGLLGKRWPHRSLDAGLSFQPGWHMPSSVGPFVADSTSWLFTGDGSSTRALLGVPGGRLRALRDELERRAVVKAGVRVAKRMGVRVAGVRVAGRLQQGLQQLRRGLAPGAEKVLCQSPPPWPSWCHTGQQPLASSSPSPTPATCSAAQASRVTPQQPCHSTTPLLTAASRRHP